MGKERYNRGDAGTFSMLRRGPKGLLPGLDAALDSLEAGGTLILTETAGHASPRAIRRSARRILMCREDREDFALGMVKDRVAVRRLR